MTHTNHDINGITWVGVIQGRPRTSPDRSLSGSESESQTATLAPAMLIQQ